MRHVRRNSQRLAGLHQDFFPVNLKTQRSGFHHGNLLVRVLMHRHHRALFNSQTRYRHMPRVNHLTGEQRAHRFFGNRAPVVMFHVR